MDNKRELKRDEIIKTTFLEWGKSSFKNMSLSLIAQKMKITKAAIYRYFKNKDELINSLVDYFIVDYLGVIEEFLDANKNTDDIEKLIYNYVVVNSNFFGKKPYYLFFHTSSMMIEKVLASGYFLETKGKEIKLFIKLFNTSNSWIKNDTVIQFINYLFGSELFLFMKSYEDKNKKELKEFTDGEIDTVITKVVDIVKNGFLNLRSGYQIDFKLIEDKSTLTKDDISARDKIFDAITSVVAKVGVWDASLEMIAKEAGMSKSIFYFYFANKEEMFGDIVFKEIEKLCQIGQEKDRIFVTFFDKFYSEIVVEFTYMLSDIRIMYFFNWLQYQKINFKSNKNRSKKMEEILKERFQFIEDALSSKLIRDFGFSFKEILSFFKMQVVKDVLLNTMFKKEVTVETYRNIYKLFLVGIYE